MYRNPQYINDDVDTVLELVERNPFGTLVSVTGDSAEATHLPCFIRKAGERLTLVTHLARSTYSNLQLESGKAVMFIFRSPDRYVSAQWYEDPVHDVPTWDYSAAHMWGQCRPVEGNRELRELLSETVDRFETGYDNPYRLEMTDSEFLDEIQPLIIGIEIPIEKMRGVFKLSQERSERDLANVLHAMDREFSGNSGCPVGHDIRRAAKLRDAT